eukprot:TRINITY_DN1835_c0_g1_i7.p2 TRINITY_DN1835_c0_g1~~TRINITY_DN1835_c0_g1_i7.p2  ORF type:complete len:132 (-),score=14.52 TRINITY_DN1835_c0_g1_i7:578-973(-)
MSTENYAYQNPDEEVRTLFISGLPEDVKEREIHNLFRLCRGYEGCKLTLSQGKPVAFASFADRNAAITAQTSLHNIKFDPSFHQTLRIEMAKSNSKTKRLLDERVWMVFLLLTAISRHSTRFKEEGTNMEA